MLSKDLDIERLEKCIKELNEKIKSELKQKQTEIDRIQSENDELSTQVVDNAEENDRLKIMLEEMEESIQDNQFTIQKLNFIEQSMEKMDEEKDWPDLFLMDDKFKDDNLVKKLHHFFNRSIQLKKQCSSMEADFVEIQQVVEQLKTEVDSNLKQLAEANQQKGALSLDVQQLLEKINSFESNESTETHKLNAINLQHQVNELEKELSYLKADLLELKPQLQKKDDKLQDLEESYLAREVDLATEIDELKAGLEKILVLEQENEKLKSNEKEIETFKETCHQQEKDLAEKTEELIEKEQDIIELNKKLVTKCSLIEELQNEVQEKMSENLQARTELESIQAESSRAAKEMVIDCFNEKFIII